MKSSSRAQQTMHRVLGVMALTTILSAYAACGASSTAISEHDWRTQIVQVRLPGKGCFTATYPSLQWRPVACTTPPSYPMLPRHRGRRRPDIVGGCTSCDVSAMVPTSTEFISTATGSFDKVTGVTSETGPINNGGQAFADTYTLQLNTNPFASPACAGSPNPMCQGWEQFVYTKDTSISQAYIQYWLLQYNTTCPMVPAGLNPWQTTPLAPGDCY